MSDEVRLSILEKVAERLRDITTAQEVQLMPSGEPERFDALHIFDEGQSPVEGEVGTSRFAMSIGIDGYVSGGTGTDAAAALNSLYADTIEALFTEPVLDGLATEIAESGLKIMVVQRASARRLSFDLSLTVFYATQRGSPRIIQS